MGTCNAGDYSLCNGEVHVEILAQLSNRWGTGCTLFNPSKSQYLYLQNGYYINSNFLKDMRS